VTFIQLIEMSTQRPDEVEALSDEWAARTAGRRRVLRTALLEDRDRPDSFVQLAEFASYEEAMENSALPETAEFAGRMRELCDTEPVFRNLDLRRSFDLA
jgi:hypothetical protein